MVQGIVVFIGVFIRLREKSVVNSLFGKKDISHHERSSKRWINLPQYHS
jgi:hypothetical protein